MPAQYDDGPKTRTETKKSGKKGMGPYSAKHVRMVEAVRETRPAKPRLGK